MQPHKIVSREEWIEARKAHMAHEKEFTRARDRLSAERRALPWVKVDKNYVFDGHGGNKTLSGFGIEEAPGISVFYRNERGDIFHTYSCFSRGLDMMNAGYHYLDLTPLGRHEEGLPYPMDWLRLRDQYEVETAA